MCYIKNYYLVDFYVYVGVVYDELVGDVCILGFYFFYVG